MIKKSIIAIVVIVAAAALVFAVGSADQNNSAGNSDQETQQNSADNGSTSDNTDAQTTISAAKAKTIAEKYIEEPGASAGTPTLSKQDGKLVYTVPIKLNGKNVGEIYIDAQTGKNLGGAGGVSE
jgi:uncharacterized membrane protein YkoI